MRNVSASEIANASTMAQAKRAAFVLVPGCGSECLSGREHTQFKINIVFSINKYLGVENSRTSLEALVKRPSFQEGTLFS